MAETYAETVAKARGAEDLVLVEREGAHAIVTLNDPAKLNPLSAPLTVRLREALTELAGEEELRAVVLTGAGGAFSAGGDLRLMRDTAEPMLEGGGGAPQIWRWIRMEFGAIARLITRTDKAFIAAVDGPAAGVGLAFALACDLLFVTERARLVPAFGRIGLLPEVGTSWLLTRRLGYQRTFELFAGGRHLSGEEAAALGLANACVPARRADRHGPRLVPADRGAAGRTWRTMMKPLLRNAADMTWEQAITMEEFAEPQCFTTAEHREAVAALLG